VSGKSGVGKTATICKLSANPLPVCHSETPGIQTSIVYWPAHIKTIDKVILFKLQLWDSGEHLLKKFDHILPACTEKVDGIFFTFSFTDKPSFEDLPQQMSRITASDSNYCRFIIGTKLDLPQSEVTQREIEEFEETWKLPILGIQNTNEVHSFAGNDFRGDMKDVAPLMNYICDELWKRDQILSGNTSATDRGTSTKYY
jgi:GTPase SAR1 family protein